MSLFTASVTDVRPLLRDERQDLLRLLQALPAQQWQMPSAVLGWTVKDLALHLLDDDLGWLSRGRDKDSSGTLEMGDHESFVVALAGKNQRWIDGAQGMSGRVITELLDWSGQQMDAFYSSMDLLGEGHVSWAGDGTVPIWFDIAQDLTERWVHQMQIREAVGRVEGFAERYLAVVLRTFIWALPHQYRVVASAGTTVQVDLAAGGAWLLVSDGLGRWSLDEGSEQAPDARAEFTSDAAWRWFTGAALPENGMLLQGPAELCQPLLAVRGILA
ncbi:maleylpyruvate isomerase family mycothiol-dependent enzyme [Krasilnikovia sp. MM14-A1259]|uniref:maleylpyruvate isomerase family mycothiol-dependent enzyme n=1 Tax=Krasilnikovia sp. MM14-A1259 TaxID=3373539 RepID=UPI0038246756